MTTPPQQDPGLPVPSWLPLDGRASDRAVRLYLVLLLRRREGRGLTKVEALEVLGCSARSLDRALAQLRALNLIPRDRPEPRLQQASLAPLMAETAPPVAETAPPVAGLAPPVAGLAPPVAGLAPPVAAAGASPPRSPSPPDPLSPPNPPATAVLGSVDAVPVSEAEELLAAAAIDHLNLQLGTAFTAGAWRDKIIRRIREHPEADLPAHIAVIDATLRQDWWRERPPTPSIVYGSAQQYERCAAALAKEPREERRRLSADAQRAADLWAAQERAAAAEPDRPLSPAVQRALGRRSTTTKETQT